MLEKILKDIRGNKYLYGVIIIVSIVLSLVFSFTLESGAYVGKANIYNSDGSAKVTITVNTKDEATNKEILDNLTNESISEVRDHFDTNVNKSTSTKKETNVLVGIIRGLLIGILICIIIISCNIFIPKNKIKSEAEISEIFDNAPIIAKFSKDFNERKIR